MRRLGFLALLLAAVPSVLRAQALPGGRWVNVDASDVAMLVLATTPDGQVHRLIPAPQFSATWRLDGGRLVMRLGDGPVDSTLVVRGDTIVDGARAVMARLPGITAAGAGVRGTWSAASPEPMERYMTFRSDGAAVLEVGFPVQASQHADTLRLESAQAPPLSFTVRLDGDTLHLRDHTGRDRRFVRRPWGCLGMSGFDANAAECR